MIPVFFIITILLVLWVHYQKRRTDRIASQSSELFWERERQANLTRKKDISNLDYIHVPVSTLPFPETDSEEIGDIQKHILNLASGKIVNFTGKSNTDLKLEYGAPNINILMEYDKNYLELVRSLYRYGKLLYDKQLTDEAASVLEYALSIKTDISANYTLLATIYKEKNNVEGINSVISAAEELTSMTKKALLANLVAIRNSAMGQ
ncbi:MAG: hypothetical protein IJ420_02185 [Lachnospiraceae bacterium]|nr:hypothetical protein [Lachnospiraceae bacterium]MBQ8632396.1 hypothetical protein [Lachnospiraceae bacterium]